MGNDLRTSGSSSSRQVRIGSKIFIHIRYNKDTFANDVAALRVKQ